MGELLIDRVIRDLDEVVAWALATRNRLGYFAALYRRVTLKVREGILTPGVFADPARLDRLDFEFAGRYLEALRLDRRGEPPTRAWRVAFTAARARRPILLQQLALGISAHINLDLGIAAARVSPGERIGALHHDFNRINEILAGLINLVERQLGEVSPWIRLLSMVAGRDGMRAVEFSLEVARVEAWRFAVALAPRSAAEQGPAIVRRDAEITRLGRRVLHPGPLLDLALLAIRARESNDVRRVIELLSRETAHVTELVGRADGPS
jgi:hypothetical protein